jgi:hypothetical protein
LPSTTVHRHYNNITRNHKSSGSITLSTSAIVAQLIITFLFWMDPTCFNFIVEIK